jgi:hypothetical protein
MTISTRATWSVYLVFAFLSGSLVSAGCKEKLPAVVKNSQGRSERPKNDEEWKEWQLALQKSREGTLFRSGRLWIVGKADQPQDAPAVASAGEEFHVFGEFELNHGITKIPLTTNTVMLCQERDSRRIGRGTAYVELTSQGGSSFLAKGKMTIDRPGEYFLVLKIRSGEAATLKLTVR